MHIIDLIDHTNASEAVTVHRINAGAIQAQ